MNFLTFDVSPDGLTRSDVAYDAETDEIVIRTVQDVEPFLRHAEIARQHSGDGKTEIRKGWLRYATIPVWLQIELKEKHGIDMLQDEQLKNPADFQKLMRLLETEYSAFKTTEAKLWRPKVS